MPNYLLNYEQILELMALNGVAISARTLTRWLQQDRALIPQQALSHKVRRYRPAHVAAFIKYRTGIPPAFDKLGTLRKTENAYAVRWEEKEAA